MSAARVIAVWCDGPALGLTCDWPEQTIAVGNQYEARAMLKRAGWARRHHGDRQVDLCPRCNPIATLEPHRCGRPRKDSR